MSYDEMPDDNSKLAEIEVTFPRLSPDDTSQCPVAVAEIVEYLQVECAFPGTVTADQLEFLRTAQVANDRYWLWLFRESDGTKCYATVAQSPTGTRCIGYEEDYYGLTPDPFLLGDYHNVF